MDDFLNIDTPENVIFGYEIAGIGSRFLAAIVDSLIIAVLLGIAYFTLALFMAAAEFVVEEVMAWIVAFYSLLTFAILWGYYILFEIVWNGQSPGKRWQRLRVLRSDGTPIGAIESFIRNLVRIIDFLPIAYGIGVVTMFINGQSRRLGDLAAGTLVVREQGTVTLASLTAGQDAVVDDYPILTGIRLDIQFPVEKLTAQDVSMAEEFLRRKEQLSNRSTMAEQIAGTLYHRMGLAPADIAGLYPEDGLALIVRAYHKERTGRA
jgi:uncharacterized RDD family membrane protein YckC